VLLQRGSQPLRRVGGVVLKAPNVPLEKGNHLNRGRGHDRRGSATRGEHGDLTHHLPRSDVSDLVSVDQNIRRAGLDQEERMTEVALGHQRLSGGELQLGCDAPDGVELRVRASRQNREGGHTTPIHAISIWPVRDVR
jgi:hypothetical protein